MVLSEVTPSRNRGPGPIDDDEAGLVHNTLSNTQTSNKKFKVELTACEQLSFSHCEVTPFRLEALDFYWLGTVTKIVVYTVERERLVVVPLFEPSNQGTL